MGEFLTKPSKEKMSEDNECDEVIKLLKYKRSDMELRACKAGEKGWKILIFVI